ncbi:UNVERIFIED_CONTAM: hypothetical protein Scaly_0048900 [Sesamum calycinum]|uniref:Rx N-terminal domain-containing protein n=1 Tax=Sesamum calycinum TaxID=2727403 RepID=A0AAW2STU9_9LAMI
MANQSGINNWMEAMEARLRRVEELVEEIGCLTDAVDFKLEALKTGLRLVKKVVGIGGTEGSVVAPKVQVPDPKLFGSEWSAKELENFLWDMKTYFQVTRMSDAEKVSITTDRLADFKVANDLEQRNDDSGCNLIDVGGTSQRSDDGDRPN